ncbi:MAG TPA: hypothetical protein VFU13_23300 [Steroidobacteraceae bacterium]|nr:hypothetical protein [Steroidobacteraceae bacterium]
MLRKAPSTPRSRIKDLLERSDLSGLSEYAWEKLSFTREEAQTLRALRPTEEHIGRWYDFIEASDERRDRSTNSNRIDAEAMACMDVLSKGLRRLKKDHVRVVLVTRVMSLIRTTRNSDALKAKGLDDVDFLRHPRMLLLPASVPRVSEEIMATLAVALDTFDRQLRAGPRETDDRGAEVEEARKIFVNALHDFERASFALDLRAEAGTMPRDLEATQSVDVEQLLQWFANDEAFEKVIRDEVAGCVQTFGYKTYSLGQAHGREQFDAHIDALIERHPTLPMATVRPLIAGAPGPVNFASTKVRESVGTCDNLEELLGNLKGKTAERYLAWALLHACRTRWDLARIYARSAADVALLASSRDDASTIQEANLLLAQVRRLGGIDGESDKVRAARTRFTSVNSHLVVRSDTADPRVPMEKAAQILEFILNVAPEEMGHDALLDQGIDLLKSANKICIDKGDTFNAARSLSQMLAYGLAAVRCRLGWRTPELPTLIRGWHKSLCEVLVRLREKMGPDEIPRRVMSMEIIGYILEHESDAGDAYAHPTSGAFSLEARRVITDMVPEPARHFARELHLQLKGSHDQIGRLIAGELEKLVGQQNLYLHWEVVYAPIWPSIRSKEIIAKELKIPHALADAVSGLDILSSVAGPTQLGVDPAHRRAFRRAARFFDRALDKLRQGQHEVPSPADFMLRMEGCYARLLEALVAADPRDTEQRLRSLVTQYESLTRDYPKAATTHFRLHVVYSELAERGDQLAGELAQSELQAATDLLDSDGMLNDLPGHWVRSTMCRRRASPLFDKARKLRKEFGTAAPSDAKVLEYLDVVRQAFRIVYDNLPFGRSLPPTDPESEVFLKLEAERRINNVVYAATLFLEVRNDYTQLHESFRSHDLIFLTQCLHPEGINKVRDDNIVHTIGCAYHVLGEASMAVRAGERLLQLIYGQGATLAARPEIVNLVDDALRWRSEAEQSRLRAAS